MTKVTENTGTAEGEGGRLLHTSSSPGVEPPSLNPGSLELCERKGWGVAVEGSDDKGERYIETGPFVRYLNEPRVVRTQSPSPSPAPVGEGTDTAAQQGVRPYPFSGQPSRRTVK